MLGRILEVVEQPQRIISLCPSQTETLFELGLDERLVGITRYCIHPRERASRICKIGGTKNVDFERIRSLNPDLIIAEKEENPKDMVERLSELAPVYVTEVVDRASAVVMIRNLGSLCGVSQRATSLTDEIEKAWQSLDIESPSGGNSSPLRVAYLIWRKPWMVVGSNTYIDSLIREAGWRNVFGEGSSSRYPEVTDVLLRNSRAEVVLLSSEPYPFQEKHLDELQALLPSAQVLLTDGEAWSWYGSRMKKFPEFLQSLRNDLGKRMQGR